MTRDRDIKKSNFVEVTSSLSTDYFDFVRNGQNLRISQANFLTSLGVTGSLLTRGEVTGIPVLYVSGAYNYIRNLIAGPGVLVSLSPQDGVKIALNLDIDKTGTPVIINEGADQPTMRSIIAGSGVSVSGIGDTVEISVSGAPASNKTVFVYDINDFPSPVGDAITLEDDTEYKLQSSISSANRYIFGADTVLSGADSTLIELEYTGSGNMFTITDKSMKIKDLFCRADSGTLFAWTDTGVDNLFRMFNCGLSCLNFGTFSGGNIIFFHNINVYDITGTGLTFASNINVLLLDIVGFNKSSGAQDVIDLNSAVFYSVTIDKILFTNNGTGYCISGLASSANINPLGIGTISNILQLGTGPILNGISYFDDLWEMQMNPQINNSIDVALATHGAATITIAGAATPVLLGSAWTLQQDHRFTGTAGGRWTYNGKGTHVEITATISGTAATATYAYSFFFYKNGVQIAASVVNRSFTAGTVGNLSMIWETELATSDYIEIFVQCDSASTNFSLSQAKIRIRS